MNILKKIKDFLKNKLFDKNKRSPWFKGFLLAEKIISDGGTIANVHEKIGDKLQKSFIEPRGIEFNYWISMKGELSRGAADYIEYYKKTLLNI